MSDTTLDPAATAQPASGTAVYSLRGTLIEACSCNVNCPCWIGEDPDLGECFAIVAYGIERGQIGEIDVSGLNLVLICHIPGNVLDGNWEIVALVDERGTQEQRDALLSAFTGKLGGPLGAQVTGTAGTFHHHGPIEGGPPLWAALLLFLFAWQAMVAAMMLPSSLPLIRLFEAASGSQERPGRARAAFLGGYAAVWTGF